MGRRLISPLFHEGAQNLRATPPCAVLCCLPILIRWRERPIPWAGYSIFNADDADFEFAAPQGSDGAAKSTEAGLCRFGVMRGSPDSRVSSLEIVTYIDTIRGGLVYEN
jgi:hypothetical protein